MSGDCSLLSTYQSINKREKIFHGKKNVPERWIKSTWKSISIWYALNANCIEGPAKKTDEINVKSSESIKKNKTFNFSAFSVLQQELVGGGN
jgi:hypothetical protein